MSVSLAALAAVVVTLTVARQRQEERKLPLVTPAGRVDLEALRAAGF